MFPALPPPAKVKINQQLASVSDAQLAALDHLLVVAAKGAKDDAKSWSRQKPLAGLAARLKGLETETVTLAHGERLVTVARIAADATPFEMLEAARKWIAAARAHKPKALGLAFAGLDESLAAAVAEAVLAATLAAEFDMPKITAKPADAKVAIRELHIFGLAARLDFTRTIATAEGTNLARWLATVPGNYLTPARYRKYLEALAKDFGWQAEFLDETALKKKKAGAFLAVVQGSEDRDAGILHLAYRPAKARRKPVALVGKGICFDTGGNNLKTGRHMFGMHGDMQGSAVALGTLIALTRLKADFAVDCWLALAQNHIGPKAYKMNDVVTASDGTTIEIVHTDAEGRMVLADTLALASQAKPSFIMDFATLTGTCVQSLGNRYSGVFTNREELLPDLMSAGRRSGERVWPFPQDRDYDTLLESKVADVKQCLIEGEADHILAGRFLGRFVKNGAPWVHVDLSASEVKGGLAHVPSDFTGFGVRFATEYLLSGK
ncbi:MAG TPA: leucyl aminopeptidase family protein [Gammaproteobacteria bacterium]